MSEILSVLKQDKHSPQSNTSSVGKLGEQFAARFLRENGYQLVLANFEAPIGRNRMGVAVSGEIDLIALDGEVLCFVEVKTRSSDDIAAPLAAVDLRKQRQITRTARIYRKIFRLEEIKYRYDVVTVLIKNRKRPEGKIFKGYWSESKFRKRTWTGEF